MFANVLIANRGEIACRIVRTARGMGIRSIAMHTPVDRGALFTRLADEAHAIGEGANGYLDQDAIIALAQKVGAECLHPGYGFLSENADFAERCAKAGIVFVGPPPEAMRTMGLKSSAKALMQRAGVPVVPGYHGDNQNPKFLREKAYEIGYPVLIKAIAGGGGRGMRRVDAHVEFDAALESAIREAEAAFGDGRVMIEKYVASPRHIEMQVFADAHGNCVHLYERDCSAQRRHQKVVEECPAPGLPRGDARRHGQGRDRCGAGRGIYRRGHGRIHPGPLADPSRGLKAPRVLLPRDEHPPSGRASGDRGGDRPRSGRVAVQNRRGGAAAAQPRRDPLLGRGDRSARLRRGSGAWLPAFGRAHPCHEPQGRGGPGRRPGRHRLRGRRQRHALLRSDDRESDRSRREPRRGAGRARKRARRRGGHRAEDQSRFPERASAQP